MRMSSDQRQIGVYIHIPFCKVKCDYCAFVSYRAEDHDVSGYLTALASEMSLRIGGLDQLWSIATVYVGGGTPSVLSDSGIGQLLSEIKSRIFPHYSSGGVEFTLEANPSSLDRKKLDTMVEWGVNRLSMGCQSIDPATLGTLGRDGSPDRFLEAYQSARAAGIQNIAVDLIFGVPGQTLPSFREDLCSLLQLDPEHVSLYALSIEEGTPLDKRLAESGESSFDRDCLDDMAADMYEIGVETLRSNGYRRYEISSLARPGYESKHNMIYWTDRPYIGLGVGAHSYLNGFRRANTASVHQYTEQIRIRGDATSTSERIDEHRGLSDAMILGLRLSSGVSIRDLKARYPSDVVDSCIATLDSHIRNGLLLYDGDTLALTDRGFLLANMVMSELV